MRLKDLTQSSKPLYIGIDPVRNLRDLAMGTVDQKNVRGILALQDLHDPKQLKALNTFYKYLQDQYGSKQKNDLGKQPVQALVEQNKIVMLSLATEKLQVVNNAENNSRMPSWISLQDGTGFRIDAYGKREDFDKEPMKPGVLNKLLKLFMTQERYNAVKDNKKSIFSFFSKKPDESRLRRDALKEAMSKQIESINDAFAKVEDVSRPKPVHVIKKDVSALV